MSEENTDIMPVVLENDYGIRPAGKPDECFYCGQKVGHRHKPDCVVVTKKVMMRFTIDIPVNVPHSWSKDDIDFRYNGGTWCADNLIDMLEDYESKNGCLCGITSAEMVEVLDDTPVVDSDD